MCDTRPVPTYRALETGGDGRRWRGLRKGIEAFEKPAYESSDTVWPGQRQLLEALELTVQVWPDRLELRGWGAVTLTGELAMGDVDILN